MKKTYELVLITLLVCVLLVGCDRTTAMVQNNNTQELQGKSDLVFVMVEEEPENSLNLSDEKTVETRRQNSSITREKNLLYSLEDSVDQDLSEEYDEQIIDETSTEIHEDISDIYTSEQHIHEWVDTIVTIQHEEQGHWEDVCVQEAWDEEVVVKEAWDEPVYRREFTLYDDGVQCHDCGAILVGSEEIDHHFDLEYNYPELVPIEERIAELYAIYDEQGYATKEQKDEFNELNDYYNAIADSFFDLHHGWWGPVVYYYDEDGVRQYYSIEVAETCWTTEHHEAIIETIHHEAVYEQRWVVDKEAWTEEVIQQICHGCGEVLNSP